MAVGRWVSKKVPAVGGLDSYLAKAKNKKTSSTQAVNLARKKNTKKAFWKNTLSGVKGPYPYVGEVKREDRTLTFFYTFVENKNRSLDWR